jgi:cyclohexa-1,5-dienecarbonyl-CoA hydratase
LTSSAPRAVQVDFRGPAALVTLDRPPVNVLDLPTIRELRGALSDIASRRDAKVVVLRSAIAGTFSAGVDVADHAPDTVGAMLETFHGVFRILDAMPQLVIAAVDGRCLGGGCELAVFCDVVLATRRSVFAVPEIDVGCFPPVAAVILPRLIGRAAFEMVLTGAPVTAAKAARIGLVTAVVPDLDAAVHRWTAALAAKSGAVLALARRAVRQGGHDSFEAALARAERLYRDELAQTADCAEGVRAFLEKRPPVWTDR